MPNKLQEFSVVELRKELSGVVGATYFSGERFMIIRNQKPSAGLVTVDDLKMLEALDRVEKSAAFKKAAKEYGGKLNVVDYFAQSLATE